MVAAGLPEPRDDHAAALRRVALEMVAVVQALRAELGSALDVRIGIHSGPVVAGVIGRRKFAYDLWGDVVNTAARMESHGVPGAVQVTQATADLLGDGWPLEPRGALEIKGKGADAGVPAAADARVEPAAPLQRRACFTERRTPSPTQRQAPALRREAPQLGEHAPGASAGAPPTKVARP